MIMNVFIMMLSIIMPPCDEANVQMCIWDSSVHGDPGGVSYVITDGELTYLKSASAGL